MLSEKRHFIYMYSNALFGLRTGGWTRPVLGPSYVENGQYLIAPPSLSDAPGDKLFFFINIILKTHDLSHYLVCPEHIRL